VSHINTSTDQYRPSSISAIAKRATRNVLLATSLVASSMAFADPVADMILCNNGSTSAVLVELVRQDLAGRSYLTRNKLILLQFDQGGYLYRVTNTANRKFYIDSLTDSLQACAFVEDILTGNLIQSNTKE
jgi:hypothetical protein